MNNILYICIVKLKAMKGFKTIFLEEARDFLISLPEQAKSKIVYNLRKAESGVMDKDLFKKLESSNIWEFRTVYGGNQYRLFAFWDTTEDALVIATHGMIKKTWKVPSKEISKAEELRRKYFELK